MLGDSKIRIARMEDPCGSFPSHAPAAARVFGICHRRLFSGRKWCAPSAAGDVARRSWNSQISIRKNRCLSIHHRASAIAYCPFVCPFPFPRDQAVSGADTDVESGHIHLRHEREARSTTIRGQWRGFVMVHSGHLSFGSMRGESMYRVNAPASVVAQHQLPASGSGIRNEDYLNCE